MKTSLFTIYSFTLITLIFVVSCQNQSDYEFYNLDRDKFLSNSTNNSLSPQQVQDILDTVEPFYIDTPEDFLIPMQSAKEAFLDALERGTFEQQSNSIPISTRASVSQYKVYERLPVVFIDEDIIQKMYFKTKFS